MGRKKRVPDGNQSATTAGHSSAISIPTCFDPSGRPLPPPLPPPPEVQDDEDDDDGPRSKRPRADNDASGEGERQAYPAKKYRPDSYYRSIEAFAKYTKSHRMFDATYVRWTEGGATQEKPIVYGIRISGTFLSWGRGKTRDAAIDAAIRAAFALVAAHGYDDFTLTDDCFTEEPIAVDSLAPIPHPPPPPPPLPPGLPPGMPPMPPGFALPPGLPPSFAVPPSLSNDVLIPQPAAPTAELAVASAVGDAGAFPSSTLIGSTSKPSITLGAKSSSAISTGLTAASTSDASKKKSTNKLVFSGEDLDETGQELSMEELRMRAPRYLNLVMKVLSKRNEKYIGE